MFSKKYAPNRILTYYLFWRIFFQMQLARDSKHIGNIIRRARKKQGLNQSKLSEKTRLRQAKISQVENGRPSARIDTLLALFAALDLELRVASRSKDWTIEMGEDS